MIPRADVVACNSWELQKLTGTDARDPQSAMRAARLLGKTTLVSSVHRGAEIGAVLADRKEAWLAAHAKSERSPNGTGDLLTALYAASILEGQTFSYGLARAVGGVAETVSRERMWRAQTPQMFRYDTLVHALAASPDVTDEAQAIEALGLVPLLVPGSARNIKITHADDAELAAFYLRDQTSQ